MPSYDVTLDFPGAVGVQNKVRVAQSFSGAVTAAEAAPTTIADGVSVDGYARVFLGVGLFVNIISADFVLWGLTGVAALPATGTIGPIAPATGKTITIDVTPLTAAGGARTPGSDDYNDTLGTAALLSAEITAAINDAANSWYGIVTASDLSGSVLITADTGGAEGNSIVLTSSSVDIPVGPFLTPNGFDILDGGGGSDVIQILDGSTWASQGFPATGPISITNAENAGHDGNYNDLGHGGAGGTLMALGSSAWVGISTNDDNSAVVTSIGSFPVTGSGTLTGGTTLASWTKVENGAFPGLTAASFLGVVDVRGYSRIFLQVSAISSPGSPSITREYRILGVDPPRLPRAHVVPQDLAILDGWSAGFSGAFSDAVPAFGAAEGFDIAEALAKMPLLQNLLFPDLAEELVEDVSGDPYKIPIEVESLTLPEPLDGTIAGVSQAEDIVTFFETATLLSAPVDWVSDVNVLVSGSSLTKNGGASPGWDAGAVSSQTFTGPGEVEWKSSTADYKMCGLSNGDTDQNYTDIDFAAYFQNGVNFYVYESGDLKFGPVPCTTASVYTASVTEAGAVRYSLDGVVQYSSSSEATFPLLVDSSLYTMSADIQYATLRSWNTWVLETLAVSGVVGGLSTVSVPGDTYTYSLVSQTPTGDYLDVSGTDLIVGSLGFDYASYTSHTVVVRSTHSVSFEYFDTTLTVNIIEVP